MEREYPTLEEVRIGALQFSILFPVLVLTWRDFKRIAFIPYYNAILLILFCLMFYTCRIYKYRISI